MCWQRKGKAMCCADFENVLRRFEMCCEDFRICSEHVSKNLECVVHNWKCVLNYIIIRNVNNA